MLAGLLAGLLARPRGPALVAVVGLVGFAVWALASHGWAESVDATVIEASRWLVYAAFFACVLTLMRSPESARLLIGLVALGALIGVAVVTVRLLVDGSGAFLADRLNEPVGYVNGQAAYLLVGLWPLLAVAERARSAWVAGSAVAVASLCAGLAVLTQSRGAMAAVIVSVVVLLVMVPGRPRRALLVLSVAAVVGALAAGPLTELSTPTTPPTDARTREAVIALLAASAALGVAWSLGTMGWRAFGPETRRERSAAARSLAAVIAGVVIVAAGVLTGPELVDKVDEEYSDFTELQPVAPDARLLSAGGNRYDYWRVAGEQFKDDPLKGIGAGNYDTTWFLERESQESIRQPHSLEMQAIGELGLVGGLAIAAFLIAVLAAFVLRSLPDRPEADPGLAVAAGGIFLIWLVQTSVDWLHLIPGLAAVALCAAAALLQPWIPVVPVPRPRGRRALIVGAAAVALVVAAVVVIRPVLALHERSAGYDVLQDDPREAIERAGRSLGYNRQSVDAHYLAAAAYARLNAYELARAQLREAIELEPSDHVSWVLLGDLETRRGDRVAAAESYRRAAALNPLDASIKQHAGDAAAQKTAPAQ